MISPFFTHNILVSFIKCSFNLEDRLGLFIISQDLPFAKIKWTLFSLLFFLFLIIVKIIFMPAKKCSYTYIKDEGHKHRLLMKIFYFSCKKYPFINTKRWEAYLQPPDEIFLFFRLHWILENKKHPPIPGECLIKISLFCYLWHLSRNACVSAKM